MQGGSTLTDEQAAALKQVKQALLDAEQTKSAMGRQFDADLLFLNTEMACQEVNLLVAKPHKFSRRVGGPCSSAVLPGVAEDAREVEGPVEASSEAHARQQGLPGVCEQDAREVGGYDDDEAD